MSTSETPKNIRPLNSMERQRFVDAVRGLLPPLVLSPIPGDPIAANDMYANALYRLSEGTLQLSETEPVDDPDFHEVVALHERTALDPKLNLRLRYSARYSVNPTKHTSAFAGKVLPAGSPIVPKSEEVLAQQYIDTLREYQGAEHPAAYTFSPARLAVVMPLIAQCHRGNLIATSAEDLP
jgi:hypothetical protein